MDEHAHRRLHLCHRCMGELQAAVDRYAGDFMPGFNLTNADPFDVWLRDRREALHRQWLGVDIACRSLPCPR
ncbi:MAG: hypothetical protein R2873_09200 [Caldilineaceae bacterium]